MSSGNNLNCSTGTQRQFPLFLDTLWAATTLTIVAVFSGMCLNSLSPYWFNPDSFGADSLTIASALTNSIFLWDSSIALPFVYSNGGNILNGLSLFTTASLLTLAIGSAALVFNGFKAETAKVVQTLAVVFLVGIASLNWIAGDFITWSSLAALPILFWGASRATQASGPTSCIIWSTFALLAIVLFSSLSGQFGLPILFTIGCALGLCSLIFQGCASPVPSNRLIALGIGTATVALSAIRSATWPFPSGDLWSIPPYAAVVPPDGAPGLVRPLVGAGLEFAVVDRIAVREMLAMPGLLIIFVTLVLFAVLALTRSQRGGYIIANRPLARLLASLLLLSTSALAVDLYCPETIARIGPIAVLSRICPATSTISLTPLFLIISSLSWGLLALIHLRPSLAVLATALLALASSSSSSLNGDTLMDNTVLSNKQLYNFHVLVSPSLKLFQRVRSLGQLTPYQEEYLQPIEVNGEAVASHNSKHCKLKHLFEGREGVRWSPGRGKQVGDEWLYIKFQSPIDLAGLELQSGKFYTDYSRGLQILAPLSCPDINDPTLAAQFGNPDLNKFGEIINMPQWFGSPRTTKDGLIYYTPQPDVFPIFERTIRVSCLLIKQTGSTPNFDWSITKIVPYGRKPIIGNG